MGEWRGEEPSRSQMVTKEPKWVISEKQTLKPENVERRRRRRKRRRRRRRKQSKFRCSFSTTSFTSFNKKTEKRRVTTRTESGFIDLLLPGLSLKHHTFDDVTNTFREIRRCRQRGLVDQQTAPATHMNNSISGKVKEVFAATWENKYKRK